jgi:2-oxoglutarate ferredoxin oxidoreductase subunit beta
MDNEIYGLTKGQPSPTSPVGMEKKASPYGTYDSPLNPIAMVLAYGASFVARGFSSQPRDLTELIKRGVRHPGFAFIQAISPCVTFYDTYAHFKETTAPIPEDHDSTDPAAAMQLALKRDVQYLGVFYEEDKLSHHARVNQVREKAGSDFSLEDLLKRFER